MENIKTLPNDIAPQYQTEKFIEDRIKYISSSQIYNAVHNTRTFVEAKINKTTMEQLYFEKYNKEYFTPEAKFKMKRGVIFENSIIELYNSYYPNSKIERADKITYKRKYKKYTYITQIDAFDSENNMIVEIKNKAKYTDDWKDEVKHFYYQQVLLQYWILSGNHKVSNKVKFIINFPEMLKELIVEIQDKDITNTLEFLNEINEKITNKEIPSAPKKAPAKKLEHKVIKDNELFSEYFSIDRKIKDLQNNLKTIKSEIENLLDPNCIYKTENYEINYQKIERVGSVDYKKIINSLNIDIDINDFRKPTTFMTRLVIKGFN